MIARVLTIILLLSFGNQESFDNYSEPLPGSGAEIDMVAISGGEFLMGSKKVDNQSPVREVEVGEKPTPRRWSGCGW